MILPKLARNLVLLMWTSSKTSFSHVAIGAKNLKPVRIAHLPYLFEKLRATHHLIFSKRTTMGIPPTIDMVYGQKFYILFPTTDANASIVSNNLSANSACVPPVMHSSLSRVLSTVFLCRFLGALLMAPFPILRKVSIPAFIIFLAFPAIGFSEKRGILATAKA